MARLRKEILTVGWTDATFSHAHRGEALHVPALRQMFHAKRSPHQARPQTRRLPPQHAPGSRRAKTTLFNVHIVLWLQRSRVYWCLSNHVTPATHCGCLSVLRLRLIELMIWVTELFHYGDIQNMLCGSSPRTPQWNGQKSSDLGRNNVINIYSEDYFTFIGVFISDHISQIWDWFQYRGARGFITHPLTVTKGSGHILSKTINYYVCWNQDTFYWSR